MILDAAAQVLSSRPDATLADIADHASVARATLYRHFPTREALLHGVSKAGIRELADAIGAASLHELPADHAIARLTRVFLRAGAKYAALIGLVEPPDPAAKDRVTQPVRDVFARAAREGVLRRDLPGEVLSEMFAALVERALRLGIDGAISPESAADAVVTLFLDGARGAVIERSPPSPADAMTRSLPA